MRFPRTALGPRSQHPRTALALSSHHTGAKLALRFTLARRSHHPRTYARATLADPRATLAAPSQLRSRYAHAALELRPDHARARFSLRSRRTRSSGDPDGHRSRSGSNQGSRVEKRVASPKGPQGGCCERRGPRISFRTVAQSTPGRPPDAAPGERRGRTPTCQPTAAPRAVHTPTCQPSTAPRTVDTLKQRCVSTRRGPKDG